jgi:hypothetical protein
MTSRPIQPEHYNYETGARKYPASKAKPDETDTHAGMPTANPFGLTQPEDETNEKTRQSEGVDQDAKVPKSGRSRLPM